MSIKTHDLESVILRTDGGMGEVLLTRTPVGCEIRFLREKDWSVVDPERLREALDRLYPQKVQPDAPH